MHANRNRKALAGRKHGPHKAPVQRMVNTEAAYEAIYIAARQKSVAGGARAG